MPHEKGQGAASSLDNNRNHSWLGAVELATSQLRGLGARVDNQDTRGEIDLPSTLRNRGRRPDSERKAGLKASLKSLRVRGYRD